MATLTDRLIDVMSQGNAWKPNREELRAFLKDLFEERYHQQDWKKFQARASFMPDEGASFAGWILAENPTSGQYQGTSFVWFPGDGGSVAVLVVGTGGFGPDQHILGRPGHRRRLQALARMHGDRLWVKPDPLDVGATVPEPVWKTWPDIEAALKAYDRPGTAVIYAAVAVRHNDAEERMAVEDLLDLFAHEHQVRTKGKVKDRWDARLTEIVARAFPHCSADYVIAMLNERRFVVLQGPPGTGKTRLALEVAKTYDGSTVVQFHPARTYEDFVIGLAPRPSSDGLRFDVRPGDLLRANSAARGRDHILVIDEINRGDLARVLGEAIFLFETGEEEREIELAHEHEPGIRRLRLEPGLRVLATLNTADRSIARVDVAIRRRFAFLEVWPQLDVVRKQGIPIAIESFEDTISTFTEYVDEAGLNLVPGHAYFLDPDPKQAPTGRDARVRRRLEHELLPLLQVYVDDRLLGAATSEIYGLSDRIAGKLRQPPE